MTIEADENQIRQIVWNLATNGLRAMPDGGCLLLFVALAAPWGNTPAEARFGVADEGTGIPADEVEAIFQPFRATFSGGTGLGLAVVHRIVSDYNGRSEVQSEVGRGTRVTVYFPVISTRRAPADG